MEKLYLHELHENSGANFTGIYGCQIPADYGYVSEELEAINDHVGLLDRSYLGKLALTGSDTLDLLNRITTNDLQYLAVDTVADTVFATPKGRLIDFCRVINTREETILVSSFFHVKHLIEWINRFVILEDVTLKDVSKEYTWLTLFGPLSRQFIGQISSKELTDKDESIWLEIEGESFPALKNNNFKYPAYNFCFPNTRAKSITAFLLEQLKSFRGMMIGNTSYQILRVESGIPDGITEITQDYNPHEARLTQSISFTKGCYTGQEVIARLDTYDKVQKYLMILELSQELIQKPPLEVYIDDENIGHLTSYIFNPATKRNVGLAYLKKMYTTENDIYVEVQSGENRIPARSRIPPQAYL